jgi:transposase-like protein
MILWGARRYVAYPISYRQMKEMMQERGGVRPDERAIEALAPH